MRTERVIKSVIRMANAATSGGPAAGGCRHRTAAATLFVSDGRRGCKCNVGAGLSPQDVQEHTSILGACCLCPVVLSLQPLY